MSGIKTPVTLKDVDLIIDKFLKETQDEFIKINKRIDLIDKKIELINDNIDNLNNKKVKFDLDNFFEKINNQLYNELNYSTNIK